MSDCRWCRKPIPAELRRDAVFCSQGCRQTAFRVRRRSAPQDASSVDQLRPLRFAYADPPYPGLARKYYKDEPTYAGEVDHRELVASLADPANGYAGWALSTSARALRDVLPLCPPEVRVCSWVKPGGAPPATYGLHGTWEPLIVLQGRRLRPGRRDSLVAHPARYGGDLVGRKPLAFCVFLFEALGLVPGDELVDLFPGSGIVGRAWAELSALGLGEPSPRPRGDASPMPAATQSVVGGRETDRGLP